MVFRVIFLVGIAVGAFLLTKAMLMKIKNGVSLDGVSWRMFLASIFIEPIFKRYGADDLVITAGEDGEHMVGSLHYKGLALDYRTWGISDVNACAAECRKKLGADYDVVVESNHIHVEYDPKT